MYRDNTLSKRDFFLSQICWLIIVWLWYKPTLFKCIDSFSLKKSGFIFIAICFACILVGSIMQFKRRRNYVSVCCNISSAYGLYSVLAYWAIKKRIIMIVMVIAIALAAIYAIIILSAKIKKKECAKVIIRRRLIRTSVGVNSIISYGIVVMLIILGINSTIGNTLFVPDVQAKSWKDIGTKETIEDSLETLRLLISDSWDSLDVDEKLSVLQTVANIEQNYLGIPHELNVRTENTRPRVAGYYDDSRHEITVSLEALMNDEPYELVNTICHEAHHAYAYRMVDAYNELDDDLKGLCIFSDVEQYKSEFADYIDSMEDEEGYYYQMCEINARNYAKDETKLYFTVIKEYMEDNTSNDGHIGKEEIIETIDGELKYYSYIISSSGHKGVIERDTGKIIVEPIYKDVIADLEYQDIQEDVDMVSFIVRDDNDEVNSYAYCWPENDQIIIP